jgi:phosphoribosylaminoimidazolecarboxamide formyltransferase/IMP cyclohydrolase
MPEDLKKMYKTIVEDPFPPRMEISFSGEGGKKQTLVFEKSRWDISGEGTKGLRYGENPGQPAALYKLVNGNLALGEVETIKPGMYLASEIELLQSGKHPGKINITDTDNALNILRYFPDKPTVVIVKHNNPCGVARDESLEKAYRKAFFADRIAAFGGAIALNRPCDKATAEAILEQYAEVVVAPDYEPGVFEMFGKKKNLRVMRIKNMGRLQDWQRQVFVEFKSLIDGGQIVQQSFLSKVQGRADLKPAEAEYKGKLYKINRMPTEKEYRDLLFGWFVELGVTSNSVIYVKDECTVGIGTGEQDRVGVAEIARDKAYKKLADLYCWQELKIPYNDCQNPEKKKEFDAAAAKDKGGLPGCAMVSDAFFPFKDGVLVGLREGVTSVIHPGGSERDFESIEACNEFNAAMVYTGQRCFKH